MNRICNLGKKKSIVDYMPQINIMPKLLLEALNTKSQKMLFGCYTVLALILVSFQLFFITSAYAFQIGNNVQTTDNLNVRGCPFLACNSIGVIPAGGAGKIINGSYSGDSYTWWYIGWDNGLTGYSVQNYLTVIPGTFSLSYETPVCDTNPPGPSPAVRLNWTTSQNASYYDVYRNGSLYASSNPGNTFYNSANLVAGQSYTYYIKAHNSSGSQNSNTISISIPSNICDSATTPASFTLNQPSTSCNSTNPQIDLSWGSSSGATSYNVYRNGAFYDNAFTSLTYKNTSVISGTTYTYYIRASNSAGYLDSNTVALTAPNCITSPQITIGPSSLNFGSVQVGSCSSAQFAIQHVSNTGNASGSVTISQNDPFKITSNSSFSLSNGQAATIDVEFCPSNSGSFSRTAVISSNANQNINSVNLSGTGLIPSPTTGAIQVNATLDGAPWSGSVIYSISGVQNFSGNTAPADFQDRPQGSYTLAYVSGGPANSTFASIASSSSLTLNGGGIITFTLNFSQAAPCTYSISPSSGSFTYSGGTSSVAVTASSSTCAWTTSESLSWVSLSPTSGTGSQTVTITATVNTGNARSGSVTIAGKTYTIIQSAATNASQTWYQDYDSDGYGNSNVSMSASSQPYGYVVDSTDCDDSDSSIHPGATEIAGDGIDQDCDGSDLEVSKTWYSDNDSDGYGDSSNSSNSTNSISQPVGYVLDNTDCDDTDATIHPGATEIPDDTIDQDCDGSDLAGSTTTFSDTNIVLIHGLNSGSSTWDKMAPEIAKYVNQSNGINKFFSSYVEIAIEHSIYDYAFCMDGSTFFDLPVPCNSLDEINDQASFRNLGNVGNQVSSFTYGLDMLDFYVSKILWKSDSENSIIEEDSIKKQKFHDNRVFAINFSNNKQLSFDAQGLELKAAIDDIKEVTGVSNFILIGHSMGGLAARAYIQNKSSQNIKALMTIDTPHLGASLSLGGILYTSKGQNAGMNLATNSKAITELNSEPKTNSKYDNILVYHLGYSDDLNDNWPWSDYFPEGVYDSGDGTVGIGTQMGLDQLSPYRVIFSSEIKDSKAYKTLDGAVEWAREVIEVDSALAMLLPGEWGEWGAHSSILKDEKAIDYIVSLLPILNGDAFLTIKSDLSFIIPKALLRSVGSNTPLLATLKLVESFVDTPPACGGVIH